MLLNRLELLLGYLGGVCELVVPLSRVDVHRHFVVAPTHVLQANQVLALILNVKSSLHFLRAHLVCKLSTSWVVN